MSCLMANPSQWVGVILAINLAVEIRGADPVYTPQNLSDSAGNTADNTSTLTWAALPAGEPYQASNPSRISAGLEPYYNLMHSFINSVFIKGIPDEIIEKALDGEYTYIVSNYSSYITYFLGFGICAAVGLLFILIFPIVACCFCCCRCCGNCGGKRQQLQKDADNTCRKYTFICILLVSAIFVLVGSICIYINNDNTSATLKSLPTVTEENLNDVKIFTNNTVQEAKHIISTNFQFLQAALFRDLDNIAYLAGLPFKTDIKDNTNIENTLATAYSLANNIDDINAALTAVENNKTALETAITDLSNGLTQVRTALDNIFTTCGTVVCPTGSRPDYSAATLDIDTSAFPDLSSARTSMDSATGTNLTEQISNAEADLEDIPNRVETDANSTVQSLKTTISDLNGNLDNILKAIENINSMVSGENATVDLDHYTNLVKDYSGNIEKYDKYRWYGGVGLSSLALLVVVLGVFGMVFGFMGTSVSTPTHERGCVSNCGGNFLIATVAVVFIFSPLLMLLTTVPFLPGAPIHKVVCEAVTDLELLQKYATMYGNKEVGEGKYWLGKLVLQNDTIPLTIKGLLSDCRDGKSAFKAFKLDSKFNIDDLLNYSKTLDVQSEIDGVTIDLSSVDVYPSTLQTQLSDVKDAVNISFASFYTELGANITSANLSALADEIDTYASSITNMLIKSQLEAQATELRRIEAEEYAYVQSNITALNTSLAEMEATVSSIPADVDALDSGLQAANDYIQTNGSNVIKSILNTYADRLLRIVDSFVDFTDTAVKNDLGSCKLVWNLYNSLLVHTFCYNLMDCFNGFWFSLGWVVFFFLPTAIFAVKSAKYFHRTVAPDTPPPYPEEEKHQFSNNGFTSDHTMPSKAQFWMKHNKVGHRDGVDD